MSDKVFDCLIIGAGPAGLTAATYLARYRRRIALVSAGDMFPSKDCEGKRMPLRISK